MIFFYIFQTFNIFDIFQKRKILNKLYNNGCNTLIQYLMTTSYQSFLPYVKISFSRTILRYVRIVAWTVRLCLSSVTLLRSTQRVKIVGNIFAPSNSLVIRQFVLDMHELEK